MPPIVSKTWSGTSLEDAMNLTQATHEKHASQCEEDMVRELAESPLNWTPKLYFPSSFQQVVYNNLFGLQASVLQQGFPT